MKDGGFFEFQTPILTASSPEGARDFLVPSRLHPGRFYALPQAPQQYKQLIMISGFDRYFQIAPCFRDEDPRADRLPGEFYQLDVEMSFVTQEDVWAALEPVIRGVFYEFAEGREVTPVFPRIRYADAMLKYGSDKPDLRNPLVIADVTALFPRGRDLQRLQARHQRRRRRARDPGAWRRAQPRSFFDKLNEWARAEGAAGLGYVVFEEEGGKLTGKGPIAKFIPAEAQAEIARRAASRPATRCSSPPARRQKAAQLAGKARARLGDELKVGQRTSSPSAGSPTSRCTSGARRRRRSTSRTTRSRCRTSSRTLPGPRSRRQGAHPRPHRLPVRHGLQRLRVASGAIRNHRPDVMKKAFGIAGYEESVLEERFGGMYRAFQYGAPPHGGMAAGIDRLVMLLVGAINLREVTLFPMNQKAEDLLLGAPSEVSPKQLRELHIRLNLPQA